MIWGQICGDKCHYYECHCGPRKSDKIEWNDGYYCCTSKNVTCVKRGRDVYCPEGRRLKWDEFCQAQNQCPVSGWSKSALTSNCSYVENQHCPDPGEKTNGAQKISKICKTDVKNIEDYCDTSQNGGICPTAHSRYDYLQCYDK